VVKTVGPQSSDGHGKAVSFKESGDVADKPKHKVGRFSGIKDFLRLPTMALGTTQINGV
jgi:hypothetical protein